MVLISHHNLDQFSDFVKIVYYMYGVKEAFSLVHYLQINGLISDFSLFVQKKPHD